jgi:DNA-binding NarL/FixJ family response regulator
VPARDAGTTENVGQRLALLSVAIVASDNLRERCRTILARAGIVRVLGRGVGLAGAPYLLRRHRPHVLLLDAIEAPLHALGVLPDLRRLSPTTSVILVGRNGASTDVVLEGVRRGARGHLSERDLPRCLPKAVRTVATGQPWLRRRLGAAIVADLRAADRAASPALQPAPSLHANALRPRSNRANAR